MKNDLIQDNFFRVKMNKPKGFFSFLPEVGGWFRSGELAGGLFFVGRNEAFLLVLQESP